MRRFSIIVALVALLAVAMACNGTVFAYFTFSGTVSNVRIAITDGDQVTFVILTSDSGVSQTFNFCGNVMSRFSTNSSVTVNYRQNGNCYSLVQVIVIGASLPSSMQAQEHLAAHAKRGTPMPTRLFRCFAITNDVSGDVKAVSRIA
jgi:hypothetical protein